MVKLSDNHRRGPRRTTVSRTPYWRPDTEEFTFVPTGPTHRQSVEVIDPETGEAIYAQDQYVHKGWTPIHAIPDDDPRRKKLPRDWEKLMRDHRHIPT